MQLQAGSSTGQQVTDYCEIRTQLPEQVSSGAANVGAGIAFNPVNPYCHVAPGVTTRATALGTYTVPKLDVQISGTLQNSPGLPVAANYTYTNAQVRQWLGRDLAQGANGQITVNLLEPGAIYSDRVNEVDVRVGKNLRFGKTRGQVALDVYNLLNANTAITLNQTLQVGGLWLAPTAIMTARIAKITVQWDF